MLSVLIPSPVRGQVLQVSIRCTSAGCVPGESEVEVHESKVVVHYHQCVC